MLSLISIASLLKSSDYDVSDVNIKKRGRKYERSSSFFGYTGNSPSGVKLNGEKSCYHLTSPEGPSPVELLLNPRSGTNTLASNNTHTQPNISGMSLLDSQDILPEANLSVTKHYNREKTRENKCVTCPACGKIFQRLCNMKSHFRIHQVSRPFSCPRCSQHFLRKHDLNRHEKIHRGAKSYFCRRCKKGFIRKDALRRHENMMPEVRRFRCVVLQADKNNHDLVKKPQDQPTSRE